MINEKYLWEKIVSVLNMLFSSLYPKQYRITMIGNIWHYIRYHKKSREYLKYMGN
jgi:hypothetical protein